MNVLHVSLAALSCAAVAFTGLWPTLFQVDPAQREREADKVIAEYNAVKKALATNREKAVAGYLARLKRSPNTDDALDPFKSIFQADDQKAQGRSAAERKSIFTRTLKDLSAAHQILVDAGVSADSMFMSDLGRAAVYSGRLGTAAKIGKELVAGSDKGFPVGIDGDEVHLGHQLLGMVALRSGYQGKAVEHLLKSAHPEGSPVMNSFGPKMRLADELYASGERQGVLAYLKEIRKFWYQRDVVDAWVKAMEANRDPRDQQWRDQTGY